MPSWENGFEHPPFTPSERIKVIPCGTKIADLLLIHHGRPTPAQNAVMSWCSGTTGLQHAAFAAFGEVQFKGITYIIYKQLDNTRLFQSRAL